MATAQDNSQSTATNKQKEGQHAPVRMPQEAQPPAPTPVFQDWAAI